MLLLASAETHEPTHVLTSAVAGRDKPWGAAVCRSEADNTIGQPGVSNMRSRQPQYRNTDHLATPPPTPLPPPHHHAPSSGAGAAALLTLKPSQGAAARCRQHLPVRGSQPASPCRPLATIHVPRSGTARYGAGAAAAAPAAGKRSAAARRPTLLLVCGLSGCACVAMICLCHWAQAAELADLTAAALNTPVETAVQACCSST